MNFADHLENHRRTDGSFDLDAAEKDRRFELETNPTELAKLAARVAAGERETWQREETRSLRKQFSQPALSPALELDVKVPIGGSTAVRLGDMNHERIRLRKDMRIKVHLDESSAFQAEMTHWLGTEQLLSGDETIQDAISRGDAA